MFGVNWLSLEVGTDDVNCHHLEKEHGQGRVQLAPNDN